METPSILRFSDCHFTGSSILHVMKNLSNYIEKNLEKT